MRSLSITKQAQKTRKNGLVTGLKIPSLPLYAITAEKIPAAVAFGIIRDDGCLYKGVVKHGGLLPGLPPKENKSNQYLVEAG